MTEKMGPKETERFFREGGRDALKNVFEGEPWESAPLIVKVANPSNYGRICRFVVVWDNKSQDHTTCPLYHHMMRKETVQIECGKPTKLELKERRDEEAAAFIPWEEREAKKCDHNLVQRLFVERRTTPKKKKQKKTKQQKKNKKVSKPTKTDKKHKKIRKAKNRSSKATKQDLSCKERVSEKILKLLMSSYNFKRSTGVGKKTNSRGETPIAKAPRGREARPFPGFLKDATERLQQRKSVKTRRSVKRKSEARRVAGKVMDGLLDKVMRCVSAQQRRREAQEKLKEAKDVVEDDLR